MIRYAVTIFLSAFLLFSLEPLIAKRILPWFGGSAAVWTTCLVFYQAALLAGYLYARILTRYSRPLLQAVLHIALLSTSLLLLPVGPSAFWRPAPSANPAWSIFAMLAATIGLPFLALSATSPLLQHWLARGGFETPFRFFAISNFASLAALLAYPLAIEPFLDGRLQSVAWSVLYCLFALFCAIVAWHSQRFPSLPQAAGQPAALQTKIAWFSLAACGSMLLLSVTNHIDENVAAVPLLWVLPLAVYLITFVFSFAARKPYRRSLWLRLLAFALGILGYSVYNIDRVEAIQISIPVFLLGLFACCMFCHSELYRLRPQASSLTEFYLVVAAGGAAGSIFIGLIAPQIFAGIYELPLTLAFTGALALVLTWNDGQWPVRILWAGVSACMFAVFVRNIQEYGQNSLSLRRSFYGSLRVVQSPHAGPAQTRSLFHGTIQHGSEFLWPQRRMRPTTYYGPDSGIGIVLRDCFTSPKRVAIVGLGAGTLAAYGNRGDIFRFYEINPQVIGLANSLFFYTRETAARIETVEGDARLSLENETAPPFDVLALDAFSGDAIPIHLLTKEALALYLRHLKPDGVIAFHVSNNYLDLAPVVRQLAETFRYRAILAKSHQDQDEDTLPADWVLVTHNETVLNDPAILAHAQPISDRPGLRPWTDDFNNLLQVMTAPRFR